MARLEVRLLGGFDVVLDGRPVTAFESDTTRALLARLAADLGRTVPRAVLAEQLWPDRPQGGALGNLRHALTVLRHTLGEVGDGPALLLVTPTTIAADPRSGWWVDAVELERLGTVPLTAAGAVAAWSAAVGLRRGRFLEDLEVQAGEAWDDWVAARSQALDAVATGCLRRLAELRERTGEHDLARRLATQWLALDPWDERAHRLLMRLLAVHGEPGAALVHLDAHATRLAAEVGGRPGPETRALADDIRAARFPPPAARPSGRTEVTDAVATQSQPFVDRVDELAWLAAHLDDAAAGAGRVVVVVGEAGSGKSVLLSAFAASALDHMPRLLVVRGRVNAYTGTGDPLLPFRQIVSQLCGDPSAMRGDGALPLVQAARLGARAPEAVDVLLREGPDLLGSVVDGEALATVLAADASRDVELAARVRAATQVASLRAGDPSRQQQPLLDQCARVLRRVAETAPLLVLVDDLQWADAGTLDLVFHLAREAAAAPLLVVVACRSEDVGAGERPLEPLLQEITALRPDGRLDLGDSPAFVDAWLDAMPNALGARFRDELFRTTRGHALFTVEVVRGMQDRGDLVVDERGRLVEGPSLDWDALPARAEAVIAGRLSRLTEEVRADLDAASVQGEDFAVAAVAAVRGVPPLDVATRLGRLASAPQPLVVPNGILRVGGELHPRYRFRHALIQRSLYRHLPGPERMSLHGATGRALLALFEGRTDEVAVDLARHFDEAGMFEEALTHHAAAGRRAMRMSSTAEAVAHLERAVELLHELDPRPELERLELGLLTSLGGCLQARLGYTAPRTGEVYERVRSLCASVGPSLDAAQALGAVITFDELRGRYRQALEGVDALVAMAAQLGLPLVGAVGDAQAGLILLMTGRPAEAVERLEQVVAAYDPARDGWLRYTLGQDLGVTALSWLAPSLWMLGRADEARQRGDEAIQLARETGHPLSLAFALSIGGCLVAHLRSEPALAARCAGEVSAIAEREDLAFYRAAALVHGGVPRARLGDPVGGLADLDQGLAGWRVMGTEAFSPWVATWRAELLLEAGRLGEAATTLDEVEASMGEEVTARHRLLLLRGRLLEQTGDLPAAAEVLADAVHLAEDQAALGPALQAATALAHVLVAGERRDGAREVLAPVVARITQGEGTHDVVAARAVLDALGDASP